MGYSALILGSTGLVGRHLLQQLCADHRYQQVTALVRQPGHFQHTKLSYEIIDFNKMDSALRLFSADHVYVCLGTTIKKAGSQAAFRTVDFDYVLQAAQLTRQAGGGSFVWISSVGADADSGNFYLQTKGELEQQIAAIAGLNASPIQPSLLLGKREEFRLGEWLAIQLSPLYAWLLVGPLAKYRPIKAEQVAAQMIALQEFSAK